MRVAAQLVGAEVDMAFSCSEWYPKNIICVGFEVKRGCPGGYLCNVTESAIT